MVKALPDVQIKYVWDHDADRAARRAKEVDATVPADLNAIWSDPEISAVIILSETNRHYDLVLAAAKAGKNMFVEKPMGITGGESREMAEAIEKAGVIFTTGYFSRTDPKNIFLKERNRRRSISETFPACARPTATTARSAAGSTRNGAGWPTRRSPASARSATSARTSWIF